MVEKTTKKRPLRFSEEELSLIQNTFSDRHDLFVVLRKLYLQIELDKNEEALLGTLKDTSGIIRKIFLPVIVGDEPVNEIIDLKMSVVLKELDIERGYIELASREALVAFNEEFLRELEDGKERKIQFEDFKFVDGDALKTYQNGYIRNTLLAHIESRLYQIQILAGESTETPEEKMKRLQQDSSK